MFPLSHLRPHIKRVAVQDLSMAIGGGGVLEVMMQKGQIEYAKRKALECFDAWNDVTGFVDKFSGYYYEMCAVIQDAVDIGSMVALGVEFQIVDGKPKEPQTAEAIRGDDAS